VNGGQGFPAEEPETESVLRKEEPASLTSVHPDPDNLTVRGHCVHLPACDRFASLPDLDLISPAKIPWVAAI
jgi:hypothetical protein